MSATTQESHDSRSAEGDEMSKQRLIEELRREIHDFRISISDSHDAACLADRIDETLRSYEASSAMQESKPFAYCPDCGKKNGPAPHVHTCSPGYVQEVKQAEPVAVVDESDDGLFIEIVYGEKGSALKLGDKLYAAPKPTPDDVLIGKKISMDVSTGDDNAGNRIFGTVVEIQDDVLLAVEDSRNFWSHQSCGCNDE
jgi:hypothetical protein